MSTKAERAYWAARRWRPVRINGARVLACMRVHKPARAVRKQGQPRGQGGPGSEE